MIERNITALKERAAEARSQAFLPEPTTQPVKRPHFERAFIEEMNSRDYWEWSVHYCETSQDYILTFKGTDITLCYSALDTWSAECNFWLVSSDIAREIDVDIWGNAERFEDVKDAMSAGFEALTKTITIKV